MGKIRKEYREDRIESYGYTSHTSGSSGSSESSGSSTSESESSSSTEKKRKHTRKKSKYKKEKKRRSESEEDVEYIERERRKKKKYIKDKDVDEISEDEEEYLRVEERKHRSRKHKHHHRKHKHKHRRHRRHRSEEEYQQERRRGASVERGDLRKEREEWDERKPPYEKSEKDRRSDKEVERKIKKEEKRSKERGDNRQVKSKWDDDDDDIQYNANKRIKPDPDAEEVRDLPRVKQERERSKRRRERDESTENGRWGTAEGEDAAQNPRGEGNQPGNEEIQKPSLALSGKLAEDTNTFNGVVIKYSQPPEARKPKRRWRWYIFKGEEDLPFLPLHRQSAYLIGRDRKVADIPTDHPSCSKQHAVLQYRLVTYEREDGTKGRTVKPYILDLDSANGTYVNNRRVESRRFVELIEKDVVKFGYSSREYILLHEGSKGDEADMPDMGVELSPVSLLRS